MTVMFDEATLTQSRTTGCDPFVAYCTGEPIMYEGVPCTVSNIRNTVKNGVRKIAVTLEVAVDKEELYAVFRRAPFSACVRGGECIVVDANNKVVCGCGRVRAEAVATAFALNQEAERMHL